MRTWEGKVIGPAGTLINVSELEKDEKVTNVADVVKSAVEDALLEQKRQFAKDVLEYDAGCASGKVEFLEHVGLPVPGYNATVTFDISDITYGDESEIESDIESAVDAIYLETGYVSNIRIDLLATDV